MKYRLFIIGVIAFSCSSQRLIETDLYFGQSKPSGDRVTEAEWNDFKEQYISKAFKEGSTIINVTGNWYDPAIHKLITESTYKVIYFYKKSGTVSKQIDSLRYWYKTLFQQQSVLRLDKKVKASF